jgi:hypothetical protein
VNGDVFAGTLRPRRSSGTISRGWSGLRRQEHATLRFAALVPAVLVLLASCGRPPSATAENVPDEMLDPAPWERAWSPEEMTRWREGVVLDISHGGTIVDDNLSPVSGATVELYGVAPDGTISSSPVGTTATTGPDGKFRVGPGPDDDWIVVVKKGDMATSWIGGGFGLAVPGVVGPLPTKVMRVGLREGRDLEGGVVDLPGRPVAGAHLLVTGECFRAQVTTGADGRFTVRAPSGSVVLVELDDPRFEHAEAPGDVPSTGRARDVTLVARETSPLSGWVKTRDGAPIAGVVVFCAGDPKIRARTGADGRFQLVVDRRQAVVAVGGGFGWRACRTPSAGDLEILLDPADGVAGRVVDRDGRPVSDARLVAVTTGYSGNLERVLGPRTASDGTFRFSWLPKPWRGATTPARFLAIKRGVGESPILAAEAPGGGDPKNANVVISGVRDVAGRATRADGTPIADAFVEARWGHWDGGVTEPEAAVLSLKTAKFARTDADGRWRIRNVPFGLHARIRCSIDGVVREQTMEPAEAGASFDFTFEPGKPIAGRVVAPDGKPVEGLVDVRAQLTMAQGTEVDRVVRAAADGTFRFEPLPAGDYQLTATGSAYDLQGVAQVKAGDESAEVRMHKKATVKFRFTFVGGEPPDAVLSLEMEPFGGGADVYRRRLLPGHSGDGVELTGVTPGRWTLHVECDTWRATMDRIEPTDGETLAVDVRLTKTLRVLGKLLLPDGSPCAGTLVVVGPVPPTKGAVISVLSGADGALDLTGLLPGRWVANVDAPGLAELRTEFELKDGPNEPVTLRIPPSGAILVRVGQDDAKGAEVLLNDPAGGRVLAWTAGAAAAMSRFYVDAEGNATLRGVRVGKVNVEVRSSGSKLKSVTVDVQADHESVVEVP